MKKFYVVFVWSCFFVLLDNEGVVFFLWKMYYSYLIGCLSFLSEQFFGWLFKGKVFDL